MRMLKGLFASVLFLPAIAAGVKLRHIPFKGSADVRAARRCSTRRAARRSATSCR